MERVGRKMEGGIKDIEVTFSSIFPNKRIVQINPVLALNNWQELQFLEPFTHQILLETSTIFGLLIDAQFDPIILGGLACALCVGNFYRNHNDVDIAITYTNISERDSIYDELLQILKSKYSLHNCRQTFENFFQFILKNAQNQEFRIDVFLVQKTDRNCTFIPTENSPFSTFKINPQFLLTHELASLQLLKTPSIEDIYRIKLNDNRKVLAIDRQLLLSGIKKQYNT